MREREIQLKVASPAVPERIKTMISSAFTLREKREVNKNFRKEMTLLTLVNNGVYVTNDVVFSSYLLLSIIYFYAPSMTLRSQTFYLSLYKRLLHMKKNKKHLT